MNASAGRRERLLKVRALAHRAALVRCATAHAAHAEAAAVDVRLCQLSTDIAVPLGPAAGRDMQGFADLSARIGHARQSIAVQIADTEHALARCDVARVAAQLAEDRMARFNANAGRDEAMQREQRVAASYPSRLPGRARAR